MASVNVTLPDCGQEVECDNTQRLATLLTPGGTVSNNGAVDAVINPSGGTVTLTQPAGASCLPVPVGATVKLPFSCSGFTFKSTAQTFLVYAK